MKALVAIPTLERADLLIRNKKFLEGIKYPDAALIIDNGIQNINIDVRIERPARNLGVSGSWNFFMRHAFMWHKYDALVILQDDIIWDAERLETAKRLVKTRKDVDLFLSHLQFSVQVHRPTNMTKIGLYDERFYPGYCEDDDYAIRIAYSKDAFYERFHELYPLPGSISEGTKKSVSWAEQNRKLFEKWGDRAFGINIPHAPWYVTNRGVKKFSIPT